MTSLRAHNALYPYRECQLPKFPQMLVWGKSVTPEQAKDIIFRTDRQLTSVAMCSGGNDKYWEDYVRVVLGFRKAQDFFESLPIKKRYPAFWEFQEALNKKLGILSLSICDTEWTSCCFVFGARGWCHPDGKIAFIDSAGRWPEIEAVVEEWELVAQTFPYLDLTVTLVDRDHDSREVYGDPFPNAIVNDKNEKALLSLRVKNGEVEILQAPIFPDTPPIERDNDEAFAKVHLSDARWKDGVYRHPGDDVYAYERGLTPADIEAYALRTRKVVAKMFSDFKRRYFIQKKAAARNPVASAD